jgi:predicted transcriptional regulator
MEASAVTKKDQVSVPLPAELRAFVERIAQAEDRSVANVIRHLIAQAARQQRTESEAA